MNKVSAPRQSQQINGISDLQICDTTCQLWASHFCHCIHTSCSYSCLLLAFREDFSLNQRCWEPCNCTVAGGSTSQCSKRKKKAAAVTRNWIWDLSERATGCSSHIFNTLNTGTHQAVYTPKDTDSRMIQAAMSKSTHVQILLNWALRTFW